MFKLNNKGFAIASILYSIMVLFLLLLLSILGMLGSRKATLDKNKKDIINELNHAYTTNKIIYTDVDRDMTIVMNCGKDEVSDALIKGVSAIGSNEQEIIGSEYIRYEGIDLDNIEKRTYNLTYFANNGGNTIIGTRNVKFIEESEVDENQGTIVNCEDTTYKAKAVMRAPGGKEKYLGIVYLNPMDKTATCDENLAAINVNSNGTPTEITSGCMKWYIYKEEGNNYKAILDHNTTGIIPWNGNNNNVQVEDSNLALQLNNLRAAWITSNSFVKKVDIITGQEIADITGNSTWTVTSTNYYLDAGPENGENQIMNLENKSKYAWLYDYTNNCLAYGCNNEDNNTYTSPLNSRESIKNAGYWVNAIKIGSSSDVWSVDSRGRLNTANANIIFYGIRPVITFSKNMINTD